MAAPQPCTLEAFHRTFQFQILWRSSAYIQYTMDRHEPIPWLQQVSTHVILFYSTLQHICYLFWRKLLAHSLSCICKYLAHCNPPKIRTLGATFGNNLLRYDTPGLQFNTWQVLPFLATWPFCHLVQLPLPLTWTALPTAGSPPGSRMRFPKPMRPCHSSPTSHCLE